jgi:hypothetical protein
MSFHSRKRNREGLRSARAADPNSHVIGRTEARGRWDASRSRPAPGGGMPRFASVLLAIMVVVLLTLGLHVLFR